MINYQRRKILKSFLELNKIINHNSKFKWQIKITIHHKTHNLALKEIINEKQLFLNKNIDNFFGIDNNQNINKMNY